MIAPLFDICMVCGRPARKPGERLCVFHDVQYLIAKSAERMRKRVGRKPAAVISIQQKQIQETKGV